MLEGAAEEAAEPPGAGASISEQARQLAEQQESENDDKPMGTDDDDDAAGASVASDGLFCLLSASAWLIVDWTRSTSARDVGDSTNGDLLPKPDSGPPP
jgi:hypothetical protein